MRDQLRLQIVLVLYYSVSAICCHVHFCSQNVHHNNFTIREKAIASISSVLVAMVTGPLIWPEHQADSLPRHVSAEEKRDV